MIPVYESSTGLLHEMGPGHLEAPVRLTLIKQALEKSNLGFEFIPSIPVTEKQLLAVHSPELIAEIKESSLYRWTEFTPDTIANQHTWNAALHAAGGSIQAAFESYKKKHVSFAMLRPPGHHATVNAAMGFCFFNNIAIAAEILHKTFQVNRIAIVDIDNHHGNGTQDIFYHRADVLYASLHASPRVAYPGTGWLEQIGEGEGIGKTLNFPLPPKTGDEEYLTAFTEIFLPVINEFSPDMILVSLGLDGLAGDPYGALSLSTTAFTQLGHLISYLADKNCHQRIAVTLEGGYNYGKIGEATVNFFSGLKTPRMIEFSNDVFSEMFENTLRKAKAIFRNYWSSI